MEEIKNKKSIKDLASQFNSDLVCGLSEEEVLKCREKYGANIIESKKRETIFVKFIKQFKDILIIIL